MLTIDGLRSFGANTAEGLARCMNNEGFYLTLVKKAASDSRMEQLGRQLAAGDLDAAFETAHVLKGMFANLSLDPLTEPISVLTEILRGRSDENYSAPFEEAEKQFEALRALSGD